MLLSSGSLELVVGGFLAGVGLSGVVSWSGVGGSSVLLSGGRASELLFLGGRASELLLLGSAGFVLLCSHDVGSLAGDLLGSDLLLLSGNGLSLQLLLVGSNSLLNLLLGSSDHVVNLGSDLLDLLLSIETLSDLLVGLDETFKLFLEAVVLVVQVGHVFVEGINFGLELNLISHHLLRVLSKSVDLISNRLLVLFKFIVFNFELSAFKLIVL